MPRGRPGAFRLSCIHDRGDDCRAGDPDRLPPRLHLQDVVDHFLQVFTARARYVFPKAPLIQHCEIAVGDDFSFRCCGSGHDVLGSFRRAVRPPYENHPIEPGETLQLISRTISQVGEIIAKSGRG
jgi:hypothetical protein